MDRTPRNPGRPSTPTVRPASQASALLGPQPLVTSTVRPRYDELPIYILEAELWIRGLSTNAGRKPDIVKRLKQHDRILLAAGKRIRVFVLEAEKDYWATQRPRVDVSSETGIGDTTDRMQLFWGGGPKRSTKWPYRARETQFTFRTSLRTVGTTSSREQTQNRTQAQVAPLPTNRVDEMPTHQGLQRGRPQR